MSTCPGAIARRTPCAAIRAICADVSVGNMSASCEALTAGVSWARSVTTSGAYERRVDDVLGHEPRLQFVAPDHVADQQIVRPVVARLGRSTSHRARLLDHDLVRVQQARHL